MGSCSTTDKPSNRRDPVSPVSPVKPVTFLGVPPIAGRAGLLGGGWKPSVHATHPQGPSV